MPIATVECSATRALDLVSIFISVYFFFLNFNCIFSEFEKKVIEGAESLNFFHSLRGCLHKGFCSYSNLYY